MDPNATSATPDPPDQPVEIRVEGVHRSFGSNHVLHGIDLEIRRGEIVAIVGPSGCGKTVLLDHLIGLLQPDRGRVLVADHNVPGSRLVDLTALDHEGMDLIRRHWAVVFQRNALFSGTVYENVALWLREVASKSEREIKPTVRESLDSVGLDFDAVAEKDRDDLSGGMAKRVAIARAVAMDPNVIFYDEPTTGLDPIFAAQIHQLLADTHRRPRSDGAERTTVFVTHDKDMLARLEPRVVMLHEGRVSFDGAYGEFKRSESDMIKPYLALMPLLNQRVTLTD